MKKTFLLPLSLLTVAAGATAAPRVPVFSEISLDGVSNGNFHGNVFVADINNDGFNDLVVKGRDLNNGWATVLKYLKGTQAGLVDGANLPDDGYSWERIVVPIDYNSDGNIDIILGSSWGSKLLKGDGTSNFELVDGDVFHLDGEINIEEGDGKSDKEKWYSGLIGVADFNNDGYPDIVTFCGNPRDDQGTPVIFQNNKGTGEFVKLEDTGLAAQRGGTLTVGDFDRDGLVDIAVAGWSDDEGKQDCITVYKNKGNFKFTEVGSASFLTANRGTQNGQIMFADFNGDGYLDLFVTGESCNQGWAYIADVYLCKNGTDFELTSNNLPVVKLSGVDCADINGDGSIDIIYVGEGTEGVVLALNNGDGTFVANTTAMPTKHRGGATVHIADINNNNQPDVMVMGYNDNNTGHFNVYNTFTTRGGVFEAPEAPKDLQMSRDGESATFSWTADSKYRYNVYVKLNDGRVVTNVPADPETGKLRQAVIEAALTGNSYTLNVNPDEISEWGVQAINGIKLGSTFTKGTLSSGVNNVAETASVKIAYNNGVLSVNADSAVEVYAMTGVKLAAFEATAGEGVALDLEAGNYIVRAGASVAKIAVK